MPGTSAHKLQQESIENTYWSWYQKRIIWTLYIATDVREQNTSATFLGRLKTTGAILTRKNKTKQKQKKY